MSGIYFALEAIRVGAGSSADCVRNNCFIYRQQLVLDFEKGGGRQALRRAFCYRGPPALFKKSFSVRESAHAQLKNSVGSTFFHNVVTPHNSPPGIIHRNSAALFVKSCMQISVLCLNINGCRLNQRVINFLLHWAGHCNLFLHTLAVS